jgi:TorA maturation chaperone TorD
MALLEAKPAVAQSLALDYLYPWLKRYTPALQEADSTRFYSSVAGFLLQVLEEVKRETTKA